MGARLLIKKIKPEPKKHDNDFRHRCEECGKAISLGQARVEIDLVPHRFIDGKSVCPKCADKIARLKAVSSHDDRIYREQFLVHVLGMDNQHGRVRDFGS